MFLYSRISDGRVRVEVAETSDGMNKVFQCKAYDSLTGYELTKDVSYGWKFASKSTGEDVSPGHLFASMQEQGNELEISYSSPMNIPFYLHQLGIVEGTCVVLVPSYAGKLDFVEGSVNTYYSEPFIEIDPNQGKEEVIVKLPGSPKRGKKAGLVVQSVKNGLITVTSGGTVSLECQLVDLDTHAALNDEMINYSWDLRRRDNSPVDTASLVDTALLLEKASGKMITLVGINRLAGGLRGRCSAINTTLSEANKVSSMEGRVEDGRSDDDPTSAGKQEDEKEDTQKSGKLESGAIWVQPGASLAPEEDRQWPRPYDIDFQGNVIPSSGIRHGMLYGWELRYGSGRPASLNQIGAEVNIDAKEGTLKVNGFRAQPEAPPGLQLRCLVDSPAIEEEIGEAGADGRVRYSSVYADVVSTTRDGDVIVEQPTRTQEEAPEIFPIVDGLNECGNLPFRTDEDIVLKCRPNDTKIDTSNVAVAWEIRHANGQLIPVSNLLARSIRQEGNSLYLNQIVKPQATPLIGRCVILSRQNFTDVYSSAYFAINKYGKACEPGDKILVTMIT
ncbi:unnamed protein product [Protopolystoma xenopodis]|uniref:Uncharacterized protein n=1 Tax=Protopolystoma xenopodis TaxID=117903 RepID=A0A3S5A4F8_9PLAT|nr:unnamed protein product [Protopolystoma xenopodis]